jgi:methylmalonyl-CoA mutase C-terminal domain/subunit
MKPPIRILIAKPGLDSHDRGAKVIARALREAGMEVIYTGIRRTPEEIVQAAMEEDVHLIGLSILAGAHMQLTGRVLELLKKNRIEDIKVILGGPIPPQDTRQLKQMGVAEVFTPGKRIKEIVMRIHELMDRARSGSALP